MKKKIWIYVLCAAAAVALLAGSFVTGRMSGRTQRNSAMMEAVMYDEMAAPAMTMSSAARGQSNALKAQDGRKLVRTADLTIRTRLFDECAQRVDALVKEMGGYVESLHQTGESLRRLYAQVRIPAQNLDAFLQGLEGAGRVTSRSESTVDKTAQYADQQARLDTLYAKRERLNELLLKAQDVADLIEIETAISDTQYQIDSWEASQKLIDSQVDMSQVNVELVEESQAQSAQADVGLLQRMKDAFCASLSWLGDFAQDAAVFAVMISPVAALALLVFGFIWFVRKRRRK